MKAKDRHSGIAGAQGLAKESSADRELPVLKRVEHRFVDLPGLRMHVAEAGSGRPLLLLHGFPQHWWEWRKVTVRLAERFRVNWPDLRGAGWTDAPRRGYTRDQLLADVVALLDALGLQVVFALLHDEEVVRPAYFCHQWWQIFIVVISEVEILQSPDVASGEAADATLAPHKSITITLDLYSHWIEDMGDFTADAMDEIL